MADRWPGRKRSGRRWKPDRRRVELGSVARRIHGIEPLIEFIEGNRILGNRSLNSMQNRLTVVVVDRVGRERLGGLWRRALVRDNIIRHADDTSAGVALTSCLPGASRYGHRMAQAAAFFDLDRTLLQGASGPLISEALRAEGLVRAEPIPGEKLLFGIFNVIGETLPSMALTRTGIKATKGWKRSSAQRAGVAVAQRLVEAVEPFAHEVIADHRSAGRKIVLATTTPFDLVAPFAEAMGFDGALATRYRTDANDRYDGTVDGEFVWNRGKARSVAVWARANLVDLEASYAYSDSIFDTPLLSSVGHPVAVNPDPRLWAYAALRGWETTWFTAPPGVPKPLGVEPQQVAAALARQEFMPWVQIDLQGVENVPVDGGTLLAMNHRSYLDPLIVGYAAGKIGRPARFLSKKEVTDAPIVGQITKSLGAIRVDRETKSGAPMKEAARALRAGELIAVFPQGTIPRGEAFFEPELQGRYGAVRLAMETGAPLVPVGLWGTEKVWPRNRKLPYVLNLANPPSVQIRIGEPYLPSSDDLAEATTELMTKIRDLLPAVAQERRVPTAAELAKTLPSG